MSGLISGRHLNRWYALLLEPVGRMLSPFFSSIRACPGLLTGATPFHAWGFGIGQGTASQLAFYFLRLAKVVTRSPGRGGGFWWADAHVLGRHGRRKPDSRAQWPRLVRTAGGHRVASCSEEDVEFGLKVSDLGLALGTPFTNEKHGLGVEDYVTKDANTLRIGRLSLLWSLNAA